MNTEKTIRETPDTICSMIIEMAAISDNMKILEPSAGEGKIIQYMHDNYTFDGNTYHLFELNKEKCEKMESSFMYNSSNIFINHMDFLKFQPDPLHTPFDRVIACPPFKGNVDVVHIEKMHTHLMHNGLLVSLTSPYWLTNNEPHQVKFREWLAGKNYYMKMLPDNSFMEKGKSVPTAIIKIYKR